MKKALRKRVLVLAVPLLCGLAAAGIVGGGSAPSRATMSQIAYATAQDRIESQYQADRKFCGGLKGQLQDLCQAQARGKADAARADLQAKFQPSPEATLEARRVTAEANYRVDRVRCEAKSDDAERDRCVAAAKAAREAAVRQAKVEKVQATGGPFAVHKR